MGEETKEIHLWITTNEAMKIVRSHGFGVTRPSMITSIQKHELGRKTAGRWYVDKNRLEKWLDEGGAA